MQHFLVEVDPGQGRFPQFRTRSKNQIVEPRYRSILLLSGLSKPGQIPGMEAHMPEFGRSLTLLISTVCMFTWLAKPATAQLPDIGLGFVEVGDPSNIAYNGIINEGGILFPAPNRGRGSVDYTYQITRSEVNTGDVLPFLAEFSTRSDSISALLTIRDTGVILRDRHYTGPGDRYVADTRFPLASQQRGGIRVSHRFAMAYCNWLHNGQSSESSSLLNGAYNIGAFDSDGSINYASNPERQPGARFAIASLDEYMKAGWFDPNKNGAGEGGWWTYAHQSDLPPTVGLPSQGGEVLVDHPNFPSLEASAALASEFGVRFFNEVPRGSFPETASYYGLLDIMAGEQEWIEDRSPTNPGATPRALINPSDAFVDVSYYGFQPWEYTGDLVTFPAGSFRLVSTIPTPGILYLFTLTPVITLPRRRR